MNANPHAGRSGSVPTRRRGAPTRRPRRGAAAMRHRRAHGALASAGNPLRARGFSPGAAVGRRGRPADEVKILRGNAARAPAVEFMAHQGGDVGRGRAHDAGEYPSRPDVGMKVNRREGEHDNNRAMVRHK
jgi:hypothetical protein